MTGMLDSRVGRSEVFLFCGLESDCAAPARAPTALSLPSPSRDELVSLALMSEVLPNSALVLWIRGSCPATSAPAVVCGAPLSVSYLRRCASVFAFSLLCLLLQLSPFPRYFWLLTSIYRVTGFYYLTRSLLLCPASHMWRESLWGNFNVCAEVLVTVPVTPAVYALSVKL